MFKKAIYIGLILFLSCSSSGDDPITPNPIPQDIIPANLVLNIEIVGVDANNPNGDGSGTIRCSASAINAVKYGFRFGTGSEIESTTGNLEFSYTEAGTRSYTVYVFAYSSTGHSINTFKEITIYVQSNSPQPVWADEFDIDGPVSSSNWFAETVPPNNGSWWNNELQHYTDRLDNAYVSNGTLKIVAKKENYTFQNSTKSYTSARLNTKNKFEFTYGRVDVRAKLPAAAGTWPAIWMLGANYDTVGWPNCGEIDIMEQTGWDKTKVLGTCHWFNSAGSNNASYGLQTTVANATSEFHVYSMEWTPTHIKILVDDIEFYQIELNASLPFSADQFLILNIAMGGDLGGTINQNFASSTMEIDYVRVYQ